MPSNKTPLRSDPATAVYYDADVYVTRTCPQCKKEYKHRTHEINWVSDFDKTILCSYNCRCKWYEAHEKKRAKWLQQTSIDARIEKVLGKKKNNEKNNL